MLNQWYKELLKFFKGIDVLIYRNYERFKESNGFIAALNANKFAINLTSYENLADILKGGKTGKIGNCLIICDEIHNMGSPNNVMNLTDKLGIFKWRLGLSATPEREYDESGNSFIEEEFSKNIYRFELEDAIKDGILCEFNYIPIYYELTNEDKEKIKETISRYHSMKNSEIPMSLEELFLNLARVRKLSKSKLPLFEDYLKTNKEILKNCLIFVETLEYGYEVQKIIHTYNKEYHTYYGQDDNINLKRFIEGELDCLITCKKISEGIDIKSVSNIVLFSSSRAKLETIQRIGRCLRVDERNPDKRANIIDFINKDDIEDKERKSTPLITKESDDEALEYEPADRIRFKWLLKLSKNVREKK